MINHPFKTVLFPIAAVLMVAAGGWALLRWDFNRGYAIPPARFRARAEKLQAGMTRDEVKATLTGYTKIKQTPSQLIFSLQAEDFHGWFLPRVGQHINVEFGPDGKMLRAWPSDG